MAFLNPTRKILAEYLRFGCDCLISCILQLIIQKASIYLILDSESYSHHYIINIVSDTFKDVSILSYEVWRLL